ncbi:MAG: hypothetical protein WDZ80_02870, partial [Candidatus Paceibacterota bacterium]
LLLELISGVHKEIIPEKDGGDSLLDLLHKISKSPNLGNNLDVASELKKATFEFNEWLNHEFEYEIYSQNIAKELRIKLTRKDTLYLIGNRCKHVLTRSNSLLKKLLKIYEKSGAEIEPDEKILILEDIDNWLLDDFGGYHFTKLCELSINVYYGIVQYLQPIYERSYIQENEYRYSYKLPEELNKEDGKFEFYELLNSIRLPFLPKIKTSKHIQKKY